MAINGMKNQEDNKVLVIGAKESFLTRVTVKKLTDAKIDAVFAVWDLEILNLVWDGRGIVTVYMDEGNRPPEDVLHFVVDKLTDAGSYLIAIGEKTDLTYIQDRVPRGLVYRTFSRPINHELYMSSVLELFEKTVAGETQKCILVVDDDPNYLGIVREWLRDSYKVAMATSGLQALKWLGKNKADLILLDHEMPVTSGPQVLQMLRSEEETKNIPVMFLTGKSDKESVMEVLSLKPEGYFLKTIERQELLSKLREFFLHK